MEAGRVVPLKFEQELTALCISWVSASLSITGSVCIVYLIVFRQRKSLETDPFRRLMVAMCVCDVIHSFWLLWQGILLPRETSPRAFAIGNRATCSMLGFFAQFGFSVAFYNGMISFHHLLTIRHGLTPSQIASRYEPYMHGLSIFWPLTTAIIGVSLGAFNENFVGPMCWFANYPQGCETDPLQPCRVFILGYVTTGGPVGVIFICIAINMLRIYWHVRSTLSRGATRSLDSVSSVDTTSSPPTSNPYTTQIQQVAAQAYLFVFVFCLTFCFGFLNQSLEASVDGTVENPWDERNIFPTIVLHQLFYPLQGFLNFFVFVRPRYLAMRDECPDLSRWKAFVEALQRDETAVRQTRSPRRGLRRQSTRSDDQTSAVAEKPNRASRLPPLRGSGHVSSFDDVDAPADNGSSGNGKEETNSNEKSDNNHERNNSSGGDAAAEVDEKIPNECIVDSQQRERSLLNTDFSLIDL